MFRSSIRLSIFFVFTLLRSSHGETASPSNAQPSQETGYRTAANEAAVTTAAFLAAAAAIHLIKRRSQRKSIDRAAKKAEKLSSEAPSEAATPPKQHAAPATSRSSDAWPTPRCTSASSPGGAQSDTLRQRSSSSWSSSSWSNRQQEQDGTEGDQLVAAVRNGASARLPELLEAAHARVVANGASPESLKQVRAQHLLSALRACAARRCFVDALKAFDHEREHIGEGCSAMWSLLLYSAVEASEFERCDGFFQCVIDNASPTPNDFTNMIRYHAQQHDADGLRSTLTRLRKADFRLDVVSRNRALSMCFANGSLPLAEILADEKQCTVAMDIVGFNTLIKGFAKAGEPLRCFTYWEQMQLRGLKPSEMTFGILLDVCIESKHFVKAKEVFADLRSSGLPMNVVHYTTFMKGLVSAGYLTEATELLDEMLKSQSTKPDLVTYSTLIKAHADHGKVKEAIAVLQRMLDQGIPADAVVFNIVLTGCCVSPMNADEVFKVYTLLVKHGLQTSTTTVSILVKALAQSYALDYALDMLNNAEERLHIKPELRLYAQLAQACARVGNGKMAMTTYRAMVRSAVLQGIPVDDTINQRLLRNCAGCGEAAAAHDLHAIVAKAGGYPRLEDIGM